jgi:hypothetical protein
MKTLYVSVLAIFLPMQSMADTAFAPLPATEVVFADQMYVTRPIVVFADSDRDPNFIRQMELLANWPTAT